MLKANLSVSILFQIQTILANTSKLNIQFILSISLRQPQHSHYLFISSTSLSITQLVFKTLCLNHCFGKKGSLYLAGLGSNTFFQILIQIQIQKFGFFKYKYKYKYVVQHWFKIQIHRFKYKYKYKYVQPNISSETVQIQNRAILWIPRYMLMACVSLCLGDTSR